MTKEKRGEEERGGAQQHRLRKKWREIFRNQKVMGILEA